MSRDPFAKKRVVGKPVVSDVEQDVDKLFNTGISSDERLHEFKPLRDEGKYAKKIRFTKHPSKGVKGDKPDIYGREVNPVVASESQVEEKKEVEDVKVSNMGSTDRKKNLTYVEYTPPAIGINWNRALLLLVAFSIIGIIFMSQIIQMVSPAMMILLWLFGMMCFLPLGVVVGWLFLDQYMRCKIMRRFRHKNYGIVNFVHKGGKRITSKIKNLDDDVIVDGTRMWLLRGEGVYYQDKDVGYVRYASITAENVITLPSNVPELFLDSETMLPLTFHKAMSESNPQQAGAVLSGHIQNQIAKNLFFKRQMQIFYVIMLALTGITFVVVLALYQDFDELSSTLSALRTQVVRLTDIVSNLNPPA